MKSIRLFLLIAAAGGFFTAGCEVAHHGLDTAGEAAEAGAGVATGAVETAGDIGTAPFR